MLHSLLPAQFVAKVNMSDAYISAIESSNYPPSPKQLNSVGAKKDEFETFWHILLTYCQQDYEYMDFQPFFFTK